MEKVSIIVPVYNSGDKLISCLNSIKKQSYDNLEVILIDDGSSDQSLNFCYQFAESDSRFHVLHHDNHGVSYTRNRGIEYSTGDYLMFVDSDDEILSDYVEIYLNAARMSNADVVLGGISFYQDAKHIKTLSSEETGNFTQKQFIEQMCIRKDGLFGYTPNKLYRSSLIKENIIRFSEDMKAQEDLHFALSVYEYCRKTTIIPYSGYLYEYAEIRRNVPIQDLIGNQQKLLRLAKKLNCSSEFQKEVVLKIRSMIYTFLYHSKTIENFRCLNELNLMKEDIVKFNEDSFEPKLVLSWFFKEKYYLIIRYFKIRNILRKMLGKK